QTSPEAAPGATRFASTRNEPGSVRSGPLASRGPAPAAGALAASAGPLAPKAEGARQAREAVPVGDQDVGADVKVAVAGGVGQAGIVQQPLVGQPEARDAWVVRRGERPQDRITQQALGHGRGWRPSGA